MKATTLRALRHHIGDAVTGWKIRAHGCLLDDGAVKSDFTGVLFQVPRIGEGMMVLRTEGDTLITSPVSEVEVAADEAIWVETLNSTYRLVFSAVQPRVHEAA